MQRLRTFDPQVDLHPEARCPGRGFSSPAVQGQGLDVVTISRCRNHGLLLCQLGERFQGHSGRSTLLVDRLVDLSQTMKEDGESPGVGEEMMLTKEPSGLVWSETGESRVECFAGRVDWLLGAVCSPLLECRHWLRLIG